jgi:hypothetical protein
MPRERGSATSSYSMVTIRVASTRYSPFCVWVINAASMPALARASCTGSRLLGYSRLRRVGKSRVQCNVQRRRRPPSVRSRIGAQHFRLCGVREWWLPAISRRSSFQRPPATELVRSGISVCPTFPISWREEDQVSNVTMFTQALRTATAAGEYVFRRERLRSGEYRSVPRRRTPSR